MPLSVSTARLPYVLPQFPGLGSPRPASREEMMAGLPLAAFALPALIAIGLVDLVLEV